MTKTEQKISKDVMTKYLKYIDKNMSNGDIFGMVRDIEKESPDDFKVDNWDEFYWFLRDYRDELKNEKSKRK